MGLREEIEQDLWVWLHEFVSVPNEFYDFRFAPCPFARAALLGDAVDVDVWPGGDFRAFVRESCVDFRARPELSTRVMVLPPRAHDAWGLVDHVERLNAELIPDNVFLNTGSAKSTRSRFPGAADPYFIVVANTLDAVLRGTEALQRSTYYDEWPAEHYEIVVERRARMAERYGSSQGGPRCRAPR